MSKLLKTLLIFITLLGVIVLVIYQMREKNNQETTKTFSISRDASQIPIEKDWKKYHKGDIEFSYPTESISFEEQDFGTMLNKFLVSEAKIGEDYNEYEIWLYPLGYKYQQNPFGSTSDIFSKPIDGSISIQEIEQKISNMDSYIKAKKIGSSSFLVLRYSNYEATPSSSIEVISPIIGSQKYSNIEIKIGCDLSQFENDGAEADSGYSRAFEVFAEKIMDGSGDRDTLERIEKAKIIAESFVPESISQAMSDIIIEIPGNFYSVVNTQAYLRSPRKGSILILPNEIDINEACVSDDCAPSVDSDGLTISVEQMGSRKIDDILVSDAQELDYARNDYIKNGVNITEISYNCDGIGCNMPNWYIVHNNFLYRFETGIIYYEGFREIVETVKF
jgi:hypothetical protein